MPDNRLTASERRQAVFYILISSFGFATMSMLVKLSGDLPVMQKCFFRNFVAAIVAFVSIRKTGGSLYVKKENRLGLAARVLFGTIGLLSNYYALQYLILPDATILGKLSPFFTILCSAVLLHEGVSSRQWAAIVISFIGCLFVVRPSFSGGSLFPYLVAILGGATSGIAYSFVRFLTMRGENKTAIIFYFSMMSCLVAVPSLVFDYAPMTWTQLCLLIGAGVAAAVGQFGMTNAYCRAPGRFLGPYEYSQLLFSAAYSFIIFHQVPTAVGVLGYCIIIAVSLWMLNSGEK